jgi:hypothetical protein
MQQKQLRRIYLLVRLTLAFIWIYHGLVPKLIFTETGEMEFFFRLKLFPGMERQVTWAIGVAEIIFGLILIVFNLRVFFILQIIALLTLALGVIVIIPELLIMPFNPLTFTVTLLTLNYIGYKLYPFVKSENQK